MTDEPAMQAGSNRLAMLAAAIRESDTVTREQLSKGVEAARRCGAWLAEAKAELPHGAWLPWLRDEVGMPPRTAQHYMRLASMPAEEMRKVAHLGVAAAARSLRKHAERETEAFLDMKAEAIRAHVARIKAEASRARESLAHEGTRDTPLEALELRLLDAMERVDEPDGLDRLIEQLVEVERVTRPGASTAVGEEQQ